MVHLSKSVSTDQIIKPDSVLTNPTGKDEVKAGQCSKRSTPEGILIATPSLEGWPTKAKETPSPHEVKLALLDTTNPVF